MFRVGTGLGQALNCENLSDIDRLDLVSADVIRGGSLFLTMAGPFAGRFAGRSQGGNRFPANPDDLLPTLPRDAKGACIPVTTLESGRKPPNATWRTL